MALLQWPNNDFGQGPDLGEDHGQGHDLSYVRHPRLVILSQAFLHQRLF